MQCNTNTNQLNRIQSSLHGEKYWTVKKYCRRKVLHGEKYFGQKVFHGEKYCRQKVFHGGKVLWAKWKLARALWAAPLSETSGSVQARQGWGYENLIWGVNHLLSFKAMSRLREFVGHFQGCQKRACGISEHRQTQINPNISEIGVVSLWAWKLSKVAKCPPIMELALIFPSKCLQYIICGHRQTYVRTNLWGHKRCVDTKCVRTHNGRVRVQCLSSSKTLQQHFSTLFFLQTCSSKILQRFMGISMLRFSSSIIIPFTITTFHQTFSPSSLPCSSSSVLLRAVAKKKNGKMWEFWKNRGGGSTQIPLLL